MQSLKEVEQAEKDLKEAIKTASKELKKKEEEIAELKLRLQHVTGNKCTCNEHAFHKVYGKTADSVRQEYIQLVKNCSGSCSLGHRVKIDGISLFKDMPGSHINLLPKHYEVCQPTPLVREAFSAMGSEVWIEPEPHREYW